MGSSKAGAIQADSRQNRLTKADSGKEAENYLDILVGFLSI